MIFSAEEQAKAIINQANKIFRHKEQKYLEEEHLRKEKQINN